jgi:hypothetical protein
MTATEIHAHVKELRRAGIHAQAPGSKLSAAMTAGADALEDSIRPDAAGMAALQWLAVGLRTAPQIHEQDPSVGVTAWNNRLASLVPNGWATWEWVKGYRMKSYTATAEGIALVAREGKPC